jgi:hypothetical protein
MPVTHRPNTQSWPNRTLSIEKVQPNLRLGCTQLIALCGKGLRRMETGGARSVSLGIFPEAEAF